MRRSASRRRGSCLLAASAAVLLLTVPPHSLGAVQEEARLGQQILRAGGSENLVVQYKIQRLTTEDRAVCDGQFPERGSTLVLNGRSPGRAVITVYDVTNTVRDRFDCSVLSGETHALWREAQGQFTNQEGLEIGIEGDQVILSGTVFSESIKREAERASLRSAHVVSRVRVDELVYLVLYGPKGRYIAAYELIDEFDFAPWHGGEQHLHAAIRIEGVTLAVLRTEAGWDSVQARAMNVVERLNGAILQLVAGSNGHFGVMEVDGRPAVFYESPGGEADVIVRVASGDELGYKRRSQGYDRERDQNNRVTGRLVAEWWRALIVDVSGLFLSQKPPEHLRRTEDGTLLALFLERARGDARGEEPLPYQIANAFQSAISSERLLLDSVGGRIPADFREGGSISGRPDQE